MNFVIVIKSASYTVLWLADFFATNQFEIPFTIRFKDGQDLAKVALIHLK